MPKKREQLKQNMQTQLNYVKDFFQRDTRTNHVHYVDALIQPTLYIGLSLFAILLYMVYLRTDHFDKLGDFVDGLCQDDWQTSANRVSSKIAETPRVVMAQLTEWGPLLSAIYFALGVSHVALVVQLYRRIVEKFGPSSGVG